MSSKYKFFIFISLISITFILYSCKKDINNFESVPIMNKKISELAKEYKELRTLKGHFSGGEWKDDLDKWNGKKHKIMDRLRELLGKPEYTKKNIINLLGDPDEIEEERLIYFWRGMHDYLYFVCKNETVQKADWFYAYE